MSKVVLAVSGPCKVIYAAIVPYAPLAGGEPLNHYTVTVREVEQATGLDFFSSLDDAEECRLESSPAPFPAQEMVR